MQESNRHWASTSPDCSTAPLQKTQGNDNLCMCQDSERALPFQQQVNALAEGCHLNCHISTNPDMHQWPRLYSGLSALGIELDSSWAPFPFPRLTRAHLLPDSVLREDGAHSPLTANKHSWPTWGLTDTSGNAVFQICFSLFYVFSCTIWLSVSTP